MSTIDDFLEKERAKMSWWDRVWQNYPDVRTTRFHAVVGVKTGSDKEEIIQPSIGMRMQALLALFFFVLLWITLLNSITNNRFPIVLFGLAFIFITGLIIFLFHRYFLSKKFNYHIKIDSSGVAIDGKLFRWEELVQTCIMERREGKTTNNYLILFVKDGSICKCNLWMFSISSAKLATLIEHFKNRK